MKIVEHRAKNILTPQKGGFLAVGPYNFTHTLSAYTGCGYGTGYCGEFCYAPHMPNWTHGPGQDAKWGQLVVAKVNAPELLDKALKSMSFEQRQETRIFMSSVTDPYQPVEAKLGITREVLKVFSKYDDLGLLVVQTRSPIAGRDLEIMAGMPYLWLSVTIETDDQSVLTSIKPGGPSIESRVKLLQAAEAHEINRQIAVSPCLPHTDNFAFMISGLMPDRVIVDTFVSGDGSRGVRTQNSPISKADLDWRDEDPAKKLYRQLDQMWIKTGWSGPGFCGIPSYTKPPRQLRMFDE